MIVVPRNRQKMRSQRDIGIYLVTYICMLTYRLAEGNCRKPEGVFVYPDQENYLHSSEVNYRCDSGKTITGGWWSTITCQRRKWSHTPKCIDRSNCIPPKVPHAEIPPFYVRASYPSGSTVEFVCNNGYKPKAGLHATCSLGDWVSLPICERDGCSAPPQVEHAVVINYDYQDSFDEKTTVVYKCKESYEMSGSSDSICEEGVWSKPGFCVPKSDNPAPTTSYITDTRDADRRVPTRPGHNGEQMPKSDNPAPTTSYITDTRDADTRVPTRPGHKGEQSEECPHDPPTINNGDVISKTEKSASYQCASFYKLVGSGTIMCRQGQWQLPPTCQPNFCKVFGKIQYLREVELPKYLKEGETDYFPCNNDYTATALCQNGNIYFHGCGSRYRWDIPSAS